MFASDSVPEVFIHNHYSQEPIFIEALTASLLSAGMVPWRVGALIKGPADKSPSTERLTVQPMASVVPYRLYGRTDVYGCYGVKIKALMDAKGSSSIQKGAAFNQQALCVQSIIHLVTDSATVGLHSLLLQGGVGQDQIHSYSLCGEFLAGFEKLVSSQNQFYHQLQETDLSRGHFLSPRALTRIYIFLCEESQWVLCCVKADRLTTRTPQDRHNAADLFSAS